MQHFNIYSPVWPYLNPIPAVIWLIKSRWCAVGLYISDKKNRTVNQSLGGKYHLECKQWNRISTQLCLVCTGKLQIYQTMHVGWKALPSSCSACWKLGLAPMESCDPASFSPHPSRTNWASALPSGTKRASALPSTLSFRGQKKDREKESRKERVEGEKEHINGFKTAAGSTSHVCWDNTQIQENLTPPGA